MKIIEKEKLYNKYKLKDGISSANFVEMIVEIEHILMVKKVHKGVDNAHYSLCGTKLKGSDYLYTFRWQDVTCLNCWRIRGINNDKLNKELRSKNGKKN